MMHIEGEAGTDMASRTLTIGNAREARWRGALCVRGVHLHICTSGTRCG